MQLSNIQQRIFEMRGEKVMLDFHLAELYEVETKALKRAVNRNILRFPTDFMFQITSEEYESLRYQIGTLDSGRGKFAKYLPYAFTEQGVSMLASVLKSEKAIDVNIAIIRTFVLLRRFALSYSELEKKIKILEKKYNKNFKEVFKALELLYAENAAKDDIKNRSRIGFRPD